MRRNPKTRFDEAKLLDFARSYLAESFPNPDRIGCPSLDALWRLAQKPTAADLSITEHLGSCSPCFRQYQELLAEARVQRQPIPVAWLFRPTRRIVAITAAICLVIIALSVAVWISNKQQTVHKQNDHIKINAPDQSGVNVVKYVPFVMDLRKAAQVRGKHGTSLSAIRLPRNPLHVSVYLPIGSDAGEYRASLKLKHTPVWSSVATAQTHNQQMVMEFDADLSSYQPGQYTLMLSSKAGLRLRQAIILTDQARQIEP